jgi:hypothetical protein
VPSQSQYPGEYGNDRFEEWTNKFPEISVTTYLRYVTCQKSEDLMLNIVNTKKVIKELFLC